MKTYEVHYDVVTAISDGSGQRKVIDVAGKKTKIENGADNLDVHAAICSIEHKQSDAIVITAVSSSDVASN